MRWAAVIPVAVGALAIVVTLATLRGVVEIVSVSQYVVNLVIGLGLGLAVDYCLLIVSRYREEVPVDGYGPAAVLRTVRRAGRTILFSSVTVALALATLLLFPQEFLYRRARLATARETAALLEGLAGESATVDPPRTARHAAVESERESARV